MNPAHHRNHQQERQTGSEPVTRRVVEQGGEDEGQHRSQAAGGDEGRWRDLGLDNGHQDDYQPWHEGQPNWPTHRPPAAAIPEVMKDAAEPKVTGRTVISSDVAPARLLAATAQVMGRLSATVKDLSPAASVETCWASRRTLTETAPDTCQDTVTS